MRLKPCPLALQATFIPWLLADMALVNFPSLTASYIQQTGFVLELRADIVSIPIRGSPSWE